MATKHTVKAVLVLVIFLLLFQVFWEIGTSLLERFGVEKIRFLVSEGAVSFEIPKLERENFSAKNICVKIGLPESVIFKKLWIRSLKAETLKVKKEKKGRGFLFPVFLERFFVKNLLVEDGFTLKLFSVRGFQNYFTFERGILRWKSVELGVFNGRGRWKGKTVELNVSLKFKGTNLKGVALVKENEIAFRGDLKKENVNAKLCFQVNLKTKKLKFAVYNGVFKNKRVVENAFFDGKVLKSALKGKVKGKTVFGPAEFEVFLSEKGFSVNGNLGSFKIKGNGRFEKTLISGNFDFETERFFYKGIVLSNVKGKVLLKGNKRSEFVKADFENLDLNVFDKPIGGRVSGSVEAVLENEKVVKFKTFITDGNIKVKGRGITLKKVKGFLEKEEKLEGFLSSEFAEVGFKGKKFVAKDVKLELKDETVHVFAKSFNVFDFLTVNNVEASYGINEKFLSGSFDATVKHPLVKGKFKGNFSGSADDITITGSGKVELQKFQKLSFDCTFFYKTEGNYGTANFNGKHGIVGISYSNGVFYSGGVLKDLVFEKDSSKLKIDVLTFNLRYPKLEGELFIPSFEVNYGGVRLVAIAGAFGKLEKGALRFGEFRLFSGLGWIKVNDLLATKDKKVKGNFDGALAVKNILKKFYPKAKFVGEVGLKGQFRYDGRLGYTVKFRGVGLEGFFKPLMDRLVITELTGVVENGKLKDLYCEGISGDGSISVSGNQKRFFLSFSNVLVGERGRWKGRIFGTGTYASGKVKLNLTMRGGKVVLGKKRKKKVKFVLPVSVEGIVRFAEPVEIKHRFGRLLVVPKLVLTTEKKELKIGGNYVIIGGKINYMGKEFEVLYGSGRLKNLIKKEGSVSVLAEREISGYLVYLQLKGSLKKCELVLSSDPPLSRSEILNLVMTGASPEDISRSSELFPAVQVAYYATSSVFKPVEEEFRKALNLERFSVEPYINRHGETVVRVIISKDLMRRFKVSGYQTTGQNPEFGGSFKVKISPKRCLETRYNNYYGFEAGIGFKVESKK